MGTWIEISKKSIKTDLAYQGRSLRGNVDRNLIVQSGLLTLSCRSLRGNVDRNIHAQQVWLNTLVVPYVGTWIEILSDNVESDIIIVVPYVGTWIEMGNIRSQGPPAPGRSLRGNVDRNRNSTADFCAT